MIGIQVIHIHSPSRVARLRSLGVVASLFLLAACGVSIPKASHDPEDARLREKFRGVHGVVLRIDAATPKRGVTITSENGQRINSASLLDLDNVRNQTYSVRGMTIPKWIRATWREGEFMLQNSVEAMWTGGTIIGDYTVPVAERIPDEVLDYIRAHGGALRLKIRLKDDGILIGWDVEERIPLKTPGAGNYLRYSFAGGDFREAQVRDGKVTDPGWQK